MEPRRRLALAQGPALPGLSQTPRSLQHTSHIKRKQVTQMRQMVLVCDDSCNSFSFSPPPLFCPLYSPLLSPLFFALKQPCCATQAVQALSVGFMGIKTQTSDSGFHMGLYVLVHRTFCNSLYFTITLHTSKACELDLHITSIKGWVDPPVFYQQLL